MLMNVKSMVQGTTSVVVCLLLLNVAMEHQACASGEFRYYIPVNEWEPTETLPKEWKTWKEGWKFFKRLDLVDTASIQRRNEPIDLEVEFHSHQVTNLAREIRVTAVQSEKDPIKEVPSQVYDEGAEDQTQRCRIVFIANLEPNQKKTYLIFFGNRDCPAPVYETDLKAKGEQYALDIENRYYKLDLAKTMGNVKTLSFKHGKTTFHAQGHGVEGSIHWNPDWSDNHTGRYRITNWTRPPHFSVVRGPVCIRIKRWGHPILALGLAAGQARKVMARVTYTFYASVPYFLMESRLEVLDEVRFSCRNDEWVGIGMPEIAWMTRDGEMGFSGRSFVKEDPAWMTFFDKQTGDGFASIHLEYQCTHPRGQPPAETSIGSGLWARYPLGGGPCVMRKGDFVRENNAYLIYTYEPREDPVQDHGLGMLVHYHQRLANPLVQQESPFSKKPLTLTNVVDALRATFDKEIYVHRQGATLATKRLSVVDLGYVSDVAILDRNVVVSLTMPYAGRETWMGWFSRRISEQVHGRIEDVSSVDTKLVRKPAWTPQRMTQKGRRRLGMLDEAQDAR